MLSSQPLWHAECIEIGDENATFRLWLARIGASATRANRLTADSKRYTLVSHSRDRPRSPTPKRRKS